ncbi:RHS repeat domain-containing protein [Pseudomonas putida]|uniref:RHS repeat domain-containing protein n=1 Tax=Pseudomonas putida TaxID=303 RepID=UPI001E31142A|nr:RHS repeat-associated core domain-containing protein [Pseudomonas putida]
MLDGSKLNGLIKHNRLLVYQDKRYSYDRFGRLYEKITDAQRLQRFEYDAEHRLVCVVQEGYGQVERIVFGYDPLGRRISKTIYKQGESEPILKILFIWQGLHLLQEIQNGLPSLYIYANSSSYAPVARLDSSTQGERIQYFHTNLAGLSEHLTDEHGTCGHTLWRSDYQGWGNTRDEWHDPKHARQQNLRFQGQYLDRETGLHYNTFRYYDPDVGRFTQGDPIGLRGGLNLFQYGPNPLGWIDPLGLICWPAARRKYWRAEAKAAPKGMYSAVNIFRMQLGLAPKIRVREFHFKTQQERTRNVSIELNHRHWPQRDGKHIDTPYNLEKVTPWEHAAKDPFRHPGSELIEIIQGLNNFKGF